MIIENPDIPESQFPQEVLLALLRDHSSGRNIIWATDDYASNGDGFRFDQSIEYPLITGDYEGIIKQGRCRKRVSRIRLKCLLHRGSATSRTTL